MVDNAQLLNSKGEYIFLFHEHALVICFAYSFNIDTANGNSIMNSRMPALGRRFCFTPFTTSEISELQIDLEDNFPLPLPGIVQYIYIPIRIQRMQYVRNAITRTQSKFPKAATEILSLLAAIHMNKTLQSDDETQLIHSGFGYYTRIIY